MSAKKPTSRRVTLLNRRMAAARRLLNPLVPDLCRAWLYPRRRDLSVHVKARQGEHERHQVLTIAWIDLEKTPGAVAHDFTQACKQLVLELGMQPIKLRTPEEAHAALMKLHIGQQFTLEGLDRRTGELTLRLV